jgi:hypothetical protein
MLRQCLHTVGNTRFKRVPTNHYRSKRWILPTADHCSKRYGSVNDSRKTLDDWLAVMHGEPPLLDPGRRLGML